MRKVPRFLVFIIVACGIEMDTDRPTGSAISQIQFSYVQYAQKHLFKFMQDGQWILSNDRVSLLVIAGL